MMKRPLFALLLAACAAPAPAPLSSPEAIRAAEQAPLDAMSAEAGWNEPFAPFTVIGNIHYVGSAGLSAFLITTPEGHILLDGGIPQTAPQIVANIAVLGFDIADVTYLLNSHAHFDHAGGLAALQLASGARFVASAADKPTLEAGRIAYGPSADIPFPPIRVDRVIADGETLTLGGVALTAYLTPGHTEGCTSWSMDATDAAGATRRVFFHCSSSVGGQSLAPESWPGMIAAYRASFARLEAVEADVLLANHGVFFDLAGKRARQLAGEDAAFVDPEELQRFNAQMRAAFEQELARQQAAP